MHCTHFEAFQIHRQINIDCDKGNICSGFTALLHSHKAIAVSFRGTTNPLQLLDEAIKSVINSWVGFAFLPNQLSVFSSVKQDQL
ncbi:hypothetical protein ANCCAN_23821 [Ancylostoma caninum]|uniref:Uncharacterized protein n=1 Tax=Ancylostoma caninum TaxID=29170 RepID=A0A368FHW2_ANCCA|nr:hypothetical protein ANCCAN_23821 [Ancylostoma caninum]